MARSDPKCRGLTVTSGRVAKKVRIGIVGTGGMAGAHARAYSAIPQAQLTACYDIVPEKAKTFAEQHETKKVASDLDGLLADVDAVSVVTPDPHHADVSLAVLAANKHLLCEKPLTTTLDDARKVAAAAERANVVHMINFSYRESAAFQRAIRLVREGALGNLRHCHSFYLQSWLSSNLWGSWTSPGLLWRLDKRFSGGVLGDIGCHILDMTTAIAGDVRRLRCDLRTFPKLENGAEVVSHGDKNLDANDTAVIELELDNGAIAVVQTTRWGSGKVHGTYGALRVDLDKSYTDLDVCLGADIHKAVWKTEASKPAPSNYQRFIKAIVNGEPGEPDIFRGAQIQAYLDACERSAESGTWQEIPAWRSEAC